MIGPDPDRVRRARPLVGFTILSALIVMLIVVTIWRGLS